MPRPPVPIAGGVRKLEIGGTPHGFAFRIDGERMKGQFVVGATHTLVPFGGAAGPRAKLAGSPLAVLTAGGALPIASLVIPGGCPVTARDTNSPGGGRAVVVSAHGHPPRTIGGTSGAGLAGLPLP